MLAAPSRERPVHASAATAGRTQRQQGSIRYGRGGSGRCGRRRSSGSIAAPRLRRLLPLWPHELADESPQGRLRVVARLRKALRAERRRGLAGHWTYDLARHVELVRLYRAEAAALADALASGTDGCRQARRPACEDQLKTTSRGAYQGPSAWPGPSGPGHSWAQPSDSRAAGPTSRGIPPETGCSGYADAA